MDGAKILDGLRAMLSNVSTEADDFDEHARMDRGVLREAIALLTPEPVTEEGLRAEGFRRHDTPFGDNWVLRVQDDLDITFFQRRWLLAEFEGGEYDLHIESMQELRTVIKALRGKP